MSTVALIGTHAPSGIKEKLSGLGFKIFEFEPDERLPLPIRSHADTLLSTIENKVFLSKEYAYSCEPLTSLLASRGYDVVKCECEVGCKYPADISFNVAIVGKYAFGRFDFVADEIKHELVDRGYTRIDVKQGYAKCSTAIISDNAIITADSGISQKSADLGIDVLKVSAAEGVIELDGYGYGFIGGACAMHENILYSCGNIELHPDFEAIRDFCEAHGVTLCSLSDGKLCDLGGIIFIN